MWYHDINFQSYSPNNKICVGCYNVTLYSDNVKWSDEFTLMVLCCIHSGTIDLQIENTWVAGASSIFVDEKCSDQIFYQNILPSLTDIHSQWTMQ